MIATIAVGIQDRPPAAPNVQNWVSDYKLVGNPSFTKAITAVSSIVFAYCGTPGLSCLFLLIWNSTGYRGVAAHIPLKEITPTWFGLCRVLITKN